MMVVYLLPSVNAAPRVSSLKQNVDFSSAHGSVVKRLGLLLLVLLIAVDCCSAQSRGSGQRSGPASFSSAQRSGSGSGPASFGFAQRSGSGTGSTRGPGPERTVNVPSSNSRTQQQRAQTNAGRQQAPAGNTGSQNGEPLQQVRQEQGEGNGERNGGGNGDNGGDNRDNGGDNGRDNGDNGEGNRDNGGGNGDNGGGNGGDNGGGNGGNGDNGGDNRDNGGGNGGNGRDNGDNGRDNGDKGGGNGDNGGDNRRSPPSPESREERSRNFKSETATNLREATQKAERKDVVRVLRESDNAKELGEGFRFEEAKRTEVLEKTPERVGDADVVAYKGIAEVVVETGDVEKMTEVVLQAITPEEGFSSGADPDELRTNIQGTLSDTSLMERIVVADPTREFLPTLARRRLTCNRCTPVNSYICAHCWPSKACQAFWWCRA